MAFTISRLLWAFFRTIHFIPMSIGITLAFFLIQKFQRKEMKLSKGLSVFLFSLYLFTFIKLVGISTNFLTLKELEMGYYMKPNFIPFSDFSFRMFFLNILLFLPMGFFVPLVFQNLKWNIKNITLLGFILSAIVETIQLLQGRDADINDLIMNTIGMFLGFIVYRLFHNINNYCIKCRHNSSQPQK